MSKLFKKNILGMKDKESTPKGRGFVWSPLEGAERVPLDHGILE